MVQLTCDSVQATCTFLLFDRVLVLLLFKHAQTAYEYTVIMLSLWLIHDIAAPDDVGCCPCK